MSDRILIHEDLQGRPETGGLSYRDFVAAIWAKHMQRGRLPPWSDASGEIAAYVNHGRWVVECPNDGCAFVVTPAEPYFICTVCRSGPHTVIFPTQRTAIETLLLRRPDAANRNWRAGESLRSLARENREHGV